MNEIWIWFQLLPLLVSNPLRLVSHMHRELAVLGIWCISTTFFPALLCLDFAWHDFTACHSAHYTHTHTHTYAMAWSVATKTASIQYPWLMKTIASPELFAFFFFLFFCVCNHVTAISASAAMQGGTCIKESHEVFPAHWDAGSNPNCPPPISNQQPAWPDPCHRLLYTSKAAGCISFMSGGNMRRINCTAKVVWPLSASVLFF